MRLRPLTYAGLLILCHPDWQGKSLWFCSAGNAHEAYVVARQTQYGLVHAAAFSAVPLEYMSRTTNVEIRMPNGRKREVTLYGGNVTRG
jgi:hypothetical protein